MPASTASRRSLGILPTRRVSVARSRAMICEALATDGLGASGACRNNLLCGDVARARRAFGSAVSRWRLAIGFGGRAPPTKSITAEGAACGGKRAYARRSRRHAPNVARTSRRCCRRRGSRPAWCRSGADPGSRGCRSGRPSSSIVLPRDLRDRRGAFRDVGRTRLDPRAQRGAQQRRLGDHRSARDRRAPARRLG